MLAGQKGVSKNRKLIPCPYVLSIRKIASREIRIKPFIVSTNERRRIVCLREMDSHENDAFKDLTVLSYLQTIKLRSDNYCMYSDAKPVPEFVGDQLICVTPWLPEGKTMLAMITIDI